MWMMDLCRLLGLGWGKKEFIAELNKHVRSASLVSDGIKKFLGMELEKLDNLY